MSGLSKISDINLPQILNIEHMSDKIGAAVAVKLCFSASYSVYIPGAENW